MIAQQLLFEYDLGKAGGAGGKGTVCGIYDTEIWVIHRSMG